jgi:hypothetical protein
MTTFNGTINSTGQITVDQAKQKETYTNVGWQFPNQWTIEEGVSYPIISPNPYGTFDGTINSTGRITDTQVKQMQTYTNATWDFEGTWAIQEDESYPILGLDSDDDGILDHEDEYPEDPTNTPPTLYFTASMTGEYKVQLPIVFESSMTGEYTILLPKTKRKPYAFIM